MSNKVPGTAGETVLQSQAEELKDVVLDVRSGQKSSIENWVRQFTYVWDKPKERLDQLLAALSEDVFLQAPMNPPISRNKTEARQAFEQTFRDMPDLRADVNNWSVSGNVLFIEITFEATIGTELVSWGNVDRFIFRDGIVVERIAFCDPNKIRKARKAYIAGMSS